MDNLIALALDPQSWMALATLIAMEVILGIDNLIFIAILTNRLPADQRPRARRMGIAAALILRLLLLGTVAYIVKLTAPIISLLGQEFSWRDLILIAGGLFLVWKATSEIHHSVDPDSDTEQSNLAPGTVSMAAVIGQIMLIDIVFSVDSIITAVGMTQKRHYDSDHHDR